MSKSGGHVESDEDWTSTDEAEATFGDRGPWVSHLSTAWHACANPQLRLPLPADPTEAFVANVHQANWDSVRHRDLVAYWAPLLHLLCFGLGWTRADLGLSRWLERGAPTDDPVLNVVHRWWGVERIREIVAWTVVTPTVREFGRQIAERAHYAKFNDEPLRDSRDLATARTRPTWRLVWEGGDPLHTVGHSFAPMTYPDDAADFNPVPCNEHRSGDPSGVPRMSITTDRYPAWHALLWHYQPKQADNGRSIRTDVYCRPVGWMGEYRWSRRTSAWFRGRHRWHALGN